MSIVFFGKRKKTRESRHFRWGFLIIYKHKHKHKHKHVSENAIYSTANAKSLIFITDVAVELKHRGEKLQLKVAAFVVIDAIDY